MSNPPGKSAASQRHRPQRSLGGHEAAGPGAGDRGRWHALLRVGLVATSVALGACATKPEPPPPVAAPRVEGLPEYMHQAEAALAAGDKDKARDAYRSAARAEPASKLPWLKLSESYFESGDYGNAVLAAQEVLHRDTSDGVAAGILAVSGLRVSTTALAVLRQQNNISPGTRGEAETLTQNLRNLLGEQVLVPRPDPVPEKRPRQRARATAVSASGAAANVSKASTPATAAPRANPFDKLK